MILQDVCTVYTVPIHDVPLYVYQLVVEKSITESQYIILYWCIVASAVTGFSICDGVFPCTFRWVFKMTLNEMCFKFFAFSSYDMNSFNYTRRMYTSFTVESDSEF